MRQRAYKGTAKGNCSGCENPLEPERHGKHRYCLSCHAAYMRTNRKTHSELSEEQRRKANARSYLNTYISRGKIKKGVCAICGNKKVQAYHLDYSKPLDVVWYCREHHLQEKSKITPA